MAPKAPPHPEANIREEQSAPRTSSPPSAAGRPPAKRHFFQMANHGLKLASPPPRPTGKAISPGSTGIFATASSCHTVFLAGTSMGVKNHDLAVPNGRLSMPVNATSSWPVWSSGFSPTIPPQAAPPAQEGGAEIALRGGVTPRQTVRRGHGPCRRRSCRPAPPGPVPRSLFGNFCFAIARWFPTIRARAPTCFYHHVQTRHTIHRSMGRSAP